MTNRVLELTTVPVEVIAGDTISNLERYGIPAAIGMGAHMVLAADDDRQYAAANVSGAHPPPSAFAKSTIDSARIARRRDPQRLGGEQRALRVQHLEVRRAAGFVAQIGDRQRLRAAARARCVSAASTSAGRAVRHQRVVRLRGTQFCTVCWYSTVTRIATGRGGLDAGDSIAFSAEERLDEPDAEAPERRGRREQVGERRRLGAAARRSALTLGKVVGARLLDAQVRTRRAPPRSAGYRGAVPAGPMAAPTAAAARAVARIDRRTAGDVRREHRARRAAGQRRERASSEPDCLARARDVGDDRGELGLRLAQVVFADDAAVEPVALQADRCPVRVLRVSSNIDQERVGGAQAEVRVRDVGRDRDAHRLAEIARRRRGRCAAASAPLRYLPHRSSSYDISRPTL